MGPLLEFTYIPAAIPSFYPFYINFNYQIDYLYDSPKDFY